MGSQVQWEPQAGMGEGGGGGEEHQAWARDGSQLSACGFHCTVGTVGRRAESLMDVITLATTRGSRSPRILPDGAVEVQLSLCRWYPDSSVNLPLTSQVRLVPTQGPWCRQSLREGFPEKMLCLGGTQGGSRS